MKHVQANKCGIQNYKCRGLQDKIHKLISYVSTDNYNYDYNLNVLRPLDKADNFNNIPRLFQGLILKTQYNNLGKLSKDRVGICDRSFNTNAQNGLLDYFQSILQLSESIFDQYQTTIDTYKTQVSDVMQKPGVLPATIKVTQFAPVPSIVIPTYTYNITPKNYDNSINNIKNELINIRNQIDNIQIPQYHYSDSWIKNQFIVVNQKIDKIKIPDYHYSDSWIRTQFTNVNTRIDNIQIPQYHYSDSWIKIQLDAINTRIDNIQIPDLSIVDTIALNIGQSPCDGFKIQALLQNNDVYLKSATKDSCSFTIDIASGGIADYMQYKLTCPSKPGLYTGSINKDETISITVYINFQKYVYDEEKKKQRYRFKDYSINTPSSQYYVQLGKVSVTRKNGLLKQNVRYSYSLSVAQNQCSPLYLFDYDYQIQIPQYHYSDSWIKINFKNISDSLSALWKAIGKINSDSWLIKKLNAISDSLKFQYNTIMSYETYIRQVPDIKAMAQAIAQASKSPCQGFKITAVFSNNNNVLYTNGSSQALNIKVAAGQIYHGTYVTSCKEASFSSVNVGLSQAHTNIYVVLKLDQNGRYQYYTHLSGKSVPAPREGFRYVCLGNITASGKKTMDKKGNINFSNNAYQYVFTSRVTQTQCSPIMINDTVAELGWKTRDKNTVYTHSNETKNNGWLPAKDC